MECWTIETELDIPNSDTFSPLAHPTLSHNWPTIKFRKTWKNNIKSITLQHLPFHWLVMPFLKQQFEHLFLLSLSISLTTGMPEKCYVIVLWNSKYISHVKPETSHTFLPIPSCQDLDFQCQCCGLFLLCLRTKCR